MGDYYRFNFLMRLLYEITMFNIRFHYKTCDRNNIFQDIFKPSLVFIILLHLREILLLSLV